jgi:cellulose synthase/poly-beta-1,6-N-acetylglucosamine synthase-like glycosyltransferase
MTGFAVAIIAAWVLTALLASAGVIDYRRTLRRVALPADWPSAVILVAVKGAGEGLARFLDALLAQDYPSYRVVFGVEAATDPAFAALSPLASGKSHRFELIVAGEATECTQKVHNLLRALSALRPTDRVVVFADADTEPAADWLRQLVRPIAVGGAAVSTGYRWQIAKDRRLPSLIAALADMSVATAARDRRWNLCWGGSMAVERRVLDRLDLPRLWARVATEDLTLTRALRRAGVPIHGAVRVLVPSPSSYSWRSLFAFGRRQYLLVRFYAPRHWLLAAWTLCVPAAGAATAVSAAVSGSLAAALCIGAAILLQLLRYRLRLSIARRVLPSEAAAEASVAVRLGWWLSPLVHIVHAAVWLGSLLGRNFEWAGIRYRLWARDKVVILDR